MVKKQYPEIGIITQFSLRKITYGIGAAACCLSPYLANREMI